MEQQHRLVQNYGRNMKFLLDFYTFQHFPFFREAINIAVLEMSEDGTLNTLKRKWWYDRSECHRATTKVCLKFNKTIFFIILKNLKQEPQDTNALNLVNVAGIFYILIGGLALAITIAVLEFFIKAKFESKQTKVYNLINYLLFIIFFSFRIIFLMS